MGTVERSTQGSTSDQQLRSFTDEKKLRKKKPGAKTEEERALRPINSQGRVRTRKAKKNEKQALGYFKEELNMSVTQKHVAVVGAGLSGLCVLKQLLDYHEKFTIVGFEMAAEIGGQWLYTEETDTDENELPVFSSIYDDLSTNLPTSLMEIPGFPHKEGPSFIHRRDVFKYLEDYADKYDIWRNVKFQTIVRKVRPLSNTTDTQWEVSYCDVRNQLEIEVEIFDAVIVCNGHFAKPNIPNISGIGNFKGRVLHSHVYRTNKSYTKKNVLLIGAMVSGMEISVQIAEVADKVFLSNINYPLQSEIPKNVFERPGVKHMTKTSVVFEDDTEEDVDEVMFCTGYLYDMSILDGVVTVENQHVMPIFKHILHIEHQSLLLVGLPNNLAYFPHNHEAARFGVRCLLGMAKLPSKQEMYEDERKEQEYRKSLGLKPQHAHIMALHDLQWSYNDDISKLGGFAPLPPVLKKLWKVVFQRNVKELLYFRHWAYKVIDEESFEGVYRKSNK